MGVDDRLLAACQVGRKRHHISLAEMPVPAKRAAGALATGLQHLGVKVETKAFFDTIVVAASAGAAAVHVAARRAAINLREIDAGRVGISLDETTTPADIEMTIHICDFARA